MIEIGSICQSVSLQADRSLLVSLPLNRNLFLPLLPVSAQLIH